MIWILIIAAIALFILLIVMLVDKQKHPEDYQIPARHKKRSYRNQINRGPGLPWMGSDKHKRR